MKTLTRIRLIDDFRGVSMGYHALNVALSAHLSRSMGLVPQFERAGTETSAQGIEAYNCYHYALGADFETLHFGEELAIHSLSPGELWLRREYLGRSDFPGIHGAFQSQIWAAADGKFSDFAEYVINGALADGVVPVGRRYRPRSDGFPVALFLGKAGEGPHRDSHDHHWYGLRQESGTLAWCSKFAGQKPKRISGQTIFDDARREGYLHFAGYFHRPATLAMA